MQHPPPKLLLPHPSISRGGGKIAKVAELPASFARSSNRPDQPLETVPGTSYHGRMRKLRVFESISIDGFFTDASGGMNWAHAGSQDPEFAAWVGGNASSGGELLFGRKTYQMMESFWPTPLAARQMPAVAEGMNAARKYVASRTIQPAWNNTLLLPDGLVPAVRDLKASPGPDVTILGSGSIAAQLGEAGLVDEYQFVIIPVALGGGRTVFATGRALRLLGHRAFPCGNVVLTYSA
jgi:dihydrofolate reductase